MIRNILFGFFLPIFDHNLHRIFRIFAMKFTSKPNIDLFWYIKICRETS